MKYRVVFFRSDGVMYSKVFDFLEDAVFYFSMKAVQCRSRLSLFAVTDDRYTQYDHPRNRSFDFMLDHAEVMNDKE